MRRRTPSSTLENAASRFLDTHRGRAAIRPAPSVGRAATRVLRPLAKRFGVGLEQLTENWAEIVGTRLAQWSAPEALQRTREGPVLVVRARGPAAAVLQAETPRLLEKIRLFAGDRAPVRLRILQGSMRPPLKRKTPMTQRQSSSQVSERVEQSPEARLLSALERFGQSVKSRNGE